ncbi:MAG: transposase [Limnochordia bacterium]
MKTKRKHSKVTFKPYQMDQLMLLPPSLDELIPEDHPVRVVSAVVDRIDMKRLVKAYKGGGTSSYHPKMMIKVIVYAYSQGMFSCRQMEKALEENIHFMWLSGGTDRITEQLTDFVQIS